MAEAIKDSAKQGMPELSSVRAKQSGSTAFRVKAKPFTKVQGKFKRWVVEVTLLSQKEAGVLKDEIIIKTNDEKKPVVRVPVEAEIVGDLAFVPSSLFFGVLHPGDKAERRVRLYSRSGQEFMIKEIKTNGVPVEVNYKPQVKSKEHTITFVLVASEETEMLKRQIEIKVASGKEEILHLPLLALIRK